MVQVPDNIQQTGANTAMAGMQASFGSAGDNASQAIMQMNAHLNDLKPYIEAKNTIHDALYKTGDITQERLAGLDPNLRNAIINRDNAFLQNNYAQIENVIQGNDKAFNNAVGIITGGIDRLEQRKEKEFNQARQILEQQVSLLGSKAFDGMPPEQIEMIEKRLGISVKDMEAGIRAKEDEARAEKEWEKNMQEKEFAHRQNVDNQQLAISRGNLAVTRANAARAANETKAPKTWGKVDYVEVSGPVQRGEAPKTQAVYYDPNGRQTTMAEWIGNNYQGGNQLSAIQQELVKSGRPELATELIERSQWASQNNDAGHIPWFLSNKLNQFGF